MGTMDVNCLLEAAAAACDSCFTAIDKIQLQNIKDKAVASGKREMRSYEMNNENSLLIACT